MEEVLETRGEARIDCASRAGFQKLGDKCDCQRHGGCHPFSSIQNILQNILGIRVGCMCCSIRSRTTGVARVYLYVEWIAATVQAWPKKMERMLKIGGTVAAIFPSILCMHCSNSVGHCRL